jgi:hypothetical protein
MLHMWDSGTVPETERSSLTSCQHGEFIIINNNTKTSILTYQLMLTNFNITSLYLLFHSLLFNHSTF